MILGSNCTRTARRVAAVLGLLAGFTLACKAASLNVTPNSLSNSYPGDLTLQITGLTSGETVLVERFIDANANGVIDAGDRMVRSFTLTDGQVTSIGGVRNGSIPGDNDLSANGQITATLSFPNGPEFTRVCGQQIFRLSSPTGSFTPTQQSITVTQAIYPQHIHGTILNGAAPLPNSVFGLLVPIGTDTEFLEGTVSDASANYSAGVTNGTYIPLGFYPGFIGSFATLPPVTVSGADVNTNIPLAPGTFTVSGTVTDAASGARIPGVQFFITSTNNEYGAFFSDTNGDYSVTLVNGKWKIQVSDVGLATGGYLRPQNKPKVTVNGANLTGQNIALTMETAMIYGTVKDGSGNPLAGVRLFGNDNVGVNESLAVSDANGNYFLAASGGTWNIGPSSPVSGLPSGSYLQSTQVTLAAGQAYQLNLVASQATFLAGHATDSQGHILNSGTMLAISSTYATVPASLAADGSFVLPVSAGDWSVTLEAQTASMWNVVPPTLNFTVVTGNSISNINYVAPVSTRTISGWVRTAAGVGLANIIVIANATINGTNYNANLATDANGNYSLAVLPGVWNVGPDSQGLAQQGYGAAYSQTIDTSSASQVVNFLVGTPTTNTMVFRFFLPVVGEFGDSTTPAVTYPVAIQRYRAIFHAFNETNPPSSDTVFFTGPPGSGLTNTMADPNFGAVQNGTDVFYFSPPVKHPPTAQGGGWTVVFRTNANNLNIPDPQAALRTLVPLPTISLSNGVLRSLTWVYHDQNGNPMGGVPFFLQSSRVDLFDQNGNPLDAELFPATTAYTYPATNLYPWYSVGELRLDYYDDLNNQYFVPFTASAPTLTGPMSLAGQQFQFQLSGPPLQNLTIQFSTNLGAAFWNTLYVTNAPASPITILDPSATNAYRWYRVLLGP